MREQCQVKFQIESYHDELICEIIEMDACHFLLGRPWQFVMEAVHEGKRNVYSFEMNEKKHNLCPCEGKKEEVQNQLLMMTDKKMATDWKYESKVEVHLQANDYEVEMTNMV